MRMALVVSLTLAGLVGVPSAAQAQDGPQAYNGVRVAGELDPKVEPQSTPAEYAGPPLQLQWSAVGRKAAEPTLGVDREGAAFYAAGDFDAFNTGALARTEIYRSLDGGLTFQEASPQALGQDIPPTTLDPYTYVDNASGRVFSIDLIGAGSYLAYSDDKGETWGSSALSSPGFNDHQSFSTVPPPVDSPLITTGEDFPNVIYYCVNHVSDSRCSRSTDGGLTFSPSGGPAYSPADGCVGGLHGHLEGDRDGKVFLPAGRCGFPYVANSDDGATTWKEVQVSDKITSEEVHTGVAVDAKKNVYTVWFDETHQLPWLASSTDGGESWSTPLMIAPPGVRAVNFPEIIAGDEGRIAVIFPGTALNDVPEDEVDGTPERQANPDRPWNSYMVVSTNALDPNPLFVSNIANPKGDPIHRGDCSGRCKGMFDFLEVTVSPLDGSTWASATDTCTTDSGCNAPDGTAGQASDAAGMAVRQLGGPWLVGATPRGGSPAGTVQIPTPSPAPPASPKPVAPSSAKAKVQCGKRKGKRLVCRVTLPDAPGGAKLGLSLLRGKATVARGTGKFRSGRAKVTLKGRRALRPGKHRLALKVSFRGATPSKSARKLRLR